MNRRYLPILLLLGSFYALVFYTLFLRPQLILDFTSFYSAMVNLAAHENPYSALYNIFSKPLSANLNPPIAFLLFKPLLFFSYHYALLIWTLLSFFCGILGAMLAFYHTVSKEFFAKNWLILLGIYLSLFPTIINITTGQIGAFLLLAMMLGYHFFNQKRNFFAGFMWGIVIALKFFPALLFIFVIQQKRYAVFCYMLLTIILAFLIPMLCYGATIYSSYYKMMAQVFWYGDNWNSSLYGYIYRLFTNKIVVDLSYILLQCLLFFFYVKRLRLLDTRFAFGSTLVMMLLMSPLGWLYYFPLLIFPFALIVSKGNFSPLSGICLFLLNLPQAYVAQKTIAHTFLTAMLASSYFYGLLALFWLINSNTISLNKAWENNTYFPICIILGFGVLVTLFRFFQQFY